MGFFCACTAHTSYTGTIGPQSEDLSKIFECLLDPMIQMCTISASTLTPLDMAVYMLNCTYRIRTILAVYENTEERTAQLETETAGHMDKLVEEQTRGLLVKSGLRDAVMLMQTWEVSVNDRLSVGSPQLCVACM